jgi:hypothetical protein
MAAGCAGVSGNATLVAATITSAAIGAALWRGIGVVAGNI